LQWHINSDLAHRVGDQCLGGALPVDGRVCVQAGLIVSAQANAAVLDEEQRLGDEWWDFCDIVEDRLSGAGVEHDVAGVVVDDEGSHR